MKRISKAKLTAKELKAIKALKPGQFILIERGNTFWYAEKNSRSTRIYRAK